ncbi:MAG TPA: serine protease [Solirubrobacteraceae bacterium]|nr:serine protease [Solirubrobacteraceae bacterium]
MTKGSWRGVGLAWATIVALAAFAALAPPLSVAQAGPLSPRSSALAAGHHARGSGVAHRRSSTHAPRRRVRAHASIIGGYLPDSAQWPWMAYLRHSDGTFCGGVLLSPTQVLTAAHCVTEDDGSVSSPGSMQIVIGRRRLSQTATGETFGVAAVTRNPSFIRRADGSLDYDTAVLTLSGASSASPAVLGTASDWASEVTVMGWGHTNHETDEFSDDLLAVDLPTWGDLQCESSWGSDYDPATNLCAGYYYGEKAVCHGDSGGPVMTTPDHGATWKLIGVVSVVKAPCNVAGYPGIFAWVAGTTLREWVLSALSPPAPGPPPPEPSALAAAPSPPPKAAAPELRMSRRDVIHALRRLINVKTHHAARRLSASCRRKSAVSFSCRVSFWAAGRHYVGRFRVREYESGGVVHWTGAFKGAHEGRRVRWT